MPFHFCGMVDSTSLIWRNCNLCYSLFVVWLTLPALYGATVIFAIHYLWYGWPYHPYMERLQSLPFILCDMVDCNSLIWNISKNEAKYFYVTQHLYGSICTFIILVCIWTIVLVCCNPVCHHNSLRTDHCTIFYIRVGFAQAYANHKCNSVLTQI